MVTVSPQAAAAFQRLVTVHGYSPIQAAGLVGNLMQESGTGLRTDIVGDAGASHGIAQWNQGRLAAMRGYQSPLGAKSELDRQVDYLAHELKTSEARAGGLIRGATDLGGAVRGGVAFERPNPKYANVANRLSYAQAVYANQTGQNPTMAASGGAPPGAAPPAAGGGGVSAPAAPVAPAMPGPSDYMAQGMTELAGLFGLQPAPGEGQPAATTPATAPVTEPPPSSVPPQQPGQDQQGSAAALMASLIDRKREQRQNLPPGMLDTGVFG